MALDPAAAACVKFCCGAADDPPAEDGCVRADHVLTFCRLTFLRLHYRMKRWAARAEQERAAGRGQIRAEGNGRSPVADLPPVPPGPEGSDG